MQYALLHLRMCIFACSLTQRCLSPIREEEERWMELEGEKGIVQGSHNNKEFPPF